MLFLLYINDLPQCLQKTTPGLYADDTEIYASSYNVNDLIDNINYDLNIITQWMKNNKLQIHPKKSKCMFIASPYKIKNIPQGIPILINNVPVPRVNSYKCLGVTLDEKLNWEHHIAVIKRMKTYVPQEFLQTVYNALIQPYFDYCCQLWDTCGIILKEKLQKCQSRAARVITGASYDIRSADVLATLGWQTLDNRRKYLKSIFIYKILNNETAPNLKENFLKINDCPIIHHLRNSQTDLVLPFPKSQFKKKTFSYSGATLWNNLSIIAKQSNSMSCFKRLMKLHFQKQ